MNAEKRIAVLLVEDHLIVREGLRRLLESEKDIVVVGEAGSGRKAVELTRDLDPDVVVMDIAMPQMNGFEATRQILEARPGTKVLILSAHDDDVYVDRVLELGAVGYLIKQTSGRFLSEAIREVRKGGDFFSPEVAKRLAKRKEDALGRKKALKSGASPLSARELEVLQLVAEGSANKQIADALGISIKTVEKHRDHVMQKLDIHETAGLTRYAIAAGVIESGIQITIV